MQTDFHYYATYCAASLAGYSAQESFEICYSAQLVDWFTKTLLAGLGGPKEAATTQVQSELINSRTDLPGRQDITRMWSSFHFLPRDLYAPVKKGGRLYKNKYRLICGPNGTLVADTVELAKGKSLQAIGLAMHVLADTWAHMNFAGTPSLVINNVPGGLVEIVCDADGNVVRERPVAFKSNPVMVDDIENGVYVQSLYQQNENSIMNLGHGRAGHLPDMSYCRYRYMPSWGDYEEITKDNPSDYWKAFTQMVYALRYLRGEVASFELNTYDEATVEPWEARIRAIFNARRLDDDADWRDLGAELSGKPLDDFDLGAFQGEYKAASGADKDHTFLGKFALASLAQKSMVTNRIYKSGNLLAGRSIDYNESLISGIKDYLALARAYAGGGNNE